MKNKCISIKRLKEHEFHTTLRKLDKKENNWPRRFEILAALESNAIKNFLKFCLNILIAYLMLTSLRSENLLTVRIQSFEASVPASYFMAAASFLILLGTISFCHLTVVMSLKIRESARMLLPGFSTSVYELLLGDQDSVALGITEYKNYFFKEIIPFSTTLSIGVLIGIFTTLVPIAAFGYLLLVEQIGLLVSGDVLLVEMIALCLGIFLVAFSALYVLVFHIPMPTKKNTRQIRWNFLWCLGTTPQSRVRQWLDSKD